MTVSAAQNDGSLFESSWKQATTCWEKGDFQGALFIFKALAAEGESYALVEIGNLYELGVVSGAPDFEEAARWYRKAVFEVSDPKANLALARMYLDGHLQADAPQETFVRHANDAGVRGEPLAWLMLGTAFEAGRLVSRDVSKAKEYYERANAAGMVLAQRRLASIAWKAQQPVAALSLFLCAVWRSLRYSLRNPTDPRLAGLTANALSTEPHNHPMQPTARSGG